MKLTKRISTCPKISRLYYRGAEHMQTMLCEPALAHGVMEGNGAYNKHAKLPAGGASLPGEGSPRAFARLGRSACRHRRLRIVAGQKLLGPATDCHRKPAAAPG